MRNPYRKHVGASVVVQTLDATFLGEIAEARGGVLALSDVVISEQRGRTPMDGTVLVPLDRLCWVQVT